MVSSFWHSQIHNEAAHLCLGSSKFCITCIEYSDIHWIFHSDLRCIVAFASHTNSSCDFSFSLQEIFCKLESSTNQQDFLNNLWIFYRYTGKRELNSISSDSDLSMDVSKSFSLSLIATPFFCRPTKGVDLVNRREDNGRKAGWKRWYTKPFVWLREVWRRILYFYEAPVVRFYYHAVSFSSTCSFFFIQLNIFICFCI